MAIVRVGVRRFARGTGAQAEPVGSSGVEVGQEWVDIDGIRLRASLNCLTGVEYHGDQPDHMAEVVVRFACEGFSTVDHREPEAPVVGFRDPRLPTEDAMAELALYNRQELALLRNDTMLNATLDAVRATRVRRLETVDAMLRVLGVDPL